MVVLGGVADGKVALVAARHRRPAGRVPRRQDHRRRSAKLVGGKGGGKPELAQGGGTDAGKLDEALESVYGLILVI